MILSTLAEICYKFYSTGRPSATNRTYSQKDILQYCRMGYGNMLRQLAFASQKNFEWKEDYFYADILTRKEFPLLEADKRGRRRVDMSEYDLYRLPRNAHIPNVYDDCGNLYTQVSVGEENFYLSADFESFLFFVIKGRGIDLYHAPYEVKGAEIEATFDSDDVEVSLDIAFDIANQILGVVLRIPGFTGREIDNSFNPPKSAQLKRAINQPQEQAEI